MQKVVNLPGKMTTLLFIGGFLIALFFTNPLFDALSDIGDTAPSMLSERFSSMYDTMKESIVWTVLLGAVLIMGISAIDKARPLLMGIVMGLVIHLILIHLGYGGVSTDIIIEPIKRVI